MDPALPNIRHLYALHEVGQCKRINQAATRVHMSQPAVTQAVAKVERAFGEQMFDRRPDGLFPTDAGTLILKRVSRALTLLKEGERLARRKIGGVGRAGFHRLTTGTQLRALTAVAKTGNFSHAAQHLKISQPAVHRAARELERLADFPFYEPLRKGVGLSPAAEIFAQHVRLAVSEYRQAHYEISAFQGHDSTRIVVGSLPLARTSIVPQAIDQLLSEAKGTLQIQCESAPFDALLRDLRFGDVDVMVGALRDPPPAEDVVQECLFSDRLFVVAAHDHPLVGRKGISLEDTLEYPWIAPPKSTPSGTYLFESLRIPQLPDTPVRIVASSMVLIRGLMQRGQYVTVMSERQIEVERKSGFIAPLDIDLADSARDIGLTYRSGWTPTQTQARFLDLLRNAARNCD